MENSNSTISVYVAGAWIHRLTLKGTMQIFRDRGYTVTSGWIERENGDYSPEMLAKDASADFSEIEEANVLVAIMDDRKYAYRGSFTEIGYALGLGRKVIIVCPVTRDLENEDHVSPAGYSHYCATNVFFWHPLINRVNTLVEAVALLETSNFVSKPPQYPIIYTNLHALRMSGFGFWEREKHHFNEDHSNWGPNQEGYQATFLTYQLPENVKEIQFTGADHFGNTDGAYHAQISTCVVHEKEMRISVKWWAGPWTLYIGYKF